MDQNLCDGVVPIEDCCSLIVAECGPRPIPSKMRGRTAWWAFLALLLVVLTSSGRLTLAKEEGEGELDGFDEADDVVVQKIATDVSASNLNPFQVEVFVSYCTQ